MDLSDLPKIVIAVNISCCNACHAKLTKLLTKLLKTNGAASFDIDKDRGLVTVKGNTDPGNLVKSISKSLCKKKTRLVLYENPMKKSREKKDEENLATNGKEKAKETEGKQATNGKGKAKETEVKQTINGKEKKHSCIIDLHDDHGLTMDLHSTHRKNNGNSNHFGLTNHDNHGHNIGEKHNNHVEHGIMIDLHNTHNHNANSNHFGPAPPNPHYPPPRGLVRYGPAQQDPAHPYFPGPTHYPMDCYGLAHQDVSHQYFAGLNNYPLNCFEPIRYDMMPPQQYGYPYRQIGYYGEREGRVSSTNNVCDYFSEENASGCAIM